MSLLFARVSAHCVSLACYRSHGSPCDWKTNTHSPFSYSLSFAVCSGFYIRVCRAKIPEEPLNTYFRMVLFKVPLVIPTHVLWLAMVFVVGILGLIGQVCHPTGPLTTLSDPNTYEDTFDDGSST